MCVIVCLWELCVTLYARGSSLVVLLYVCVCVYKRDYFESTYLITQQMSRLPSVRDSTSSVCTLYDSLCLFVFLPDLSSAIFSFFSLSLPLCLSVITLKSCTVPMSRSELLQNCSAIRNCEFLNKTFFCCLSPRLGILLCWTCCTIIE